MANIYYVGLNAYQQCPQREKTNFQKVLTKWQKYSFKTTGEVVCTFRKVVIKTDNSFIIYGIQSENCDCNYKTISFNGPVKAFLVTDYFVVIAKNNKFQKYEYTNCWSEIPYSFSKNEDTLLWNNKTIDKLCFLHCNQNIVVLLNDGSVWQMDRNYILTIVYSPDLDKAVDIACGLEHTMILTESGCVMTFGNGSRGQLGHGDLFPSTESLQVLGLGGLKVVKMAAGGWHSCAVTDCGDLYMWGWNNFGQLTEVKEGSSSEDSYDVTALPRLVDIDENTEKLVIDVACGTRHTVVMTDQGELYSTGWNEYGQLGINDLSFTKVNRFKKIELQLGKGRKHLLCGPWSTLLYELESYLV